MKVSNRRAFVQFPERYPALYPGKQVKTVTFIVTHRCNLCCTYCYERNKSDARMSLSTAKRCVDLLFEEDEKQTAFVNDVDAHGLVLDFIGGEPLLEIELIDQIMSYFLNEAIRRNHRWRTQYMISMSTNGTLGDDPRVKRFMAKYRGRLSLGVTIDGSKEAHDACRVDAQGNGSYDRAIELFRRTANPNGKSTKYTIAPGNINLLYNAVRNLVVNEGIDDLNCNCVFEDGWTLEHAQVLYQQLKAVSDMLREKKSHAWVSILDWLAGDPLPETDTQNWCGGNCRMLAFDTDGTVLPCMRYSNLSTGGCQPLYRIGDVFSGIATQPDDIERVDALRAITRQSQSEEQCLSCPIASGCAWCTAYNYEVTGTPNKRVTYICIMHQARVLAQVYHHNMLHREDPTHPAKRMNVPRDWAIPIIGEDEWSMLHELSCGNSNEK